MLNYVKHDDIGCHWQPCAVHGCQWQRDIVGSKCLQIYVKTPKVKLQNV